MSKLVLCRFLSIPAADPQLADFTLTSYYHCSNAAVVITCRGNERQYCFQHHALLHGDSWTAALRQTGWPQTSETWNMQGTLWTWKTWGINREFCATSGKNCNKQNFVTSGGSSGAKMLLRCSWGSTLVPAGGA